MKNKKTKNPKSTFFKKASKKNSKNPKVLKKNIILKKTPQVAVKKQIKPNIQDNNVSKTVLSNLIKYISAQTNIHYKEKESYILLLEKKYTENDDKNSVIIEYIMQNNFEL